MNYGWRKASYSQGASNCVEASSFRKSTKCDGGTCVEAGSGPGVTGVRDSQLGAAGPVLEFSTGAWSAFLAGLK
jgi:hypothetical protein